MQTQTLPLLPTEGSETHRIPYVMVNPDHGINLHNNQDSGIHAANINPARPWPIYKVC